MKKLIVLVTIVLAAALLACTIAWAMPAFLKTFASTYKVDKDSELGKASCATCHVSKTNLKELNPYGKDLAKALKEADTKTLSKEILAKVEKLDSDKDGRNNITEIKAGTLPGNSKSK